MKIITWKLDQPNNPPEGFELGEIPSDFGMSRTAYKWREALPGEQSPFTDGRMIEASLERGNSILVRADGSRIKMRHWGSIEMRTDDFIALLQEAARDGVEIDP